MMTLDAEPLVDGVVAKTAGPLSPAPELEVQVAEDEGRELQELAAAATAVTRSCSDKMPPSSFSPKLSL